VIHRENDLTMSFDLAVEERVDLVSSPQPVDVEKRWTEDDDCEARSRQPLINPLDYPTAMLDRKLVVPDADSCGHKLRGESTCNILVLGCVADEDVVLLGHVAAFHEEQRGVRIRTVVLTEDISLYFAT
jgi:hypothetical protein